MRHDSGCYCIEGEGERGGRGIGGIRVENREEEEKDVMGD